MLPVFLGHILWSLAAIVVPGGMCYFAARRYRAERDARVGDLQQQSERAAAAGAQAAGSLARRSGSSSGGSGATPAAPLQRNSLREPLLSIPEDSSDASGGEPLPVQTLEELPACVRTFLARSIRDGRSFRLFVLQQLGQMKLDPKGGWKETTATQRACPLEPAFVWTASARLAPLVSIKGCDSYVGGSGYCTWRLWGAVSAASGSGQEVDQSLHMRWLAEAVCFPQALQPSSFLRWEEVKGEELEAEAVLRYGGGPPLRAIFTFDRFGRVARMRTHDFLRRTLSGSFERGEWQVAYSGHMLFGLSPQGPVLQEEVATHSGIVIPTNMEAAWVQPDGSRWVYAKMSVAKVTAEV